MDVCKLLEDEDVIDFADALEHSGCANRFVSLVLKECNVCEEGMCALTASLRRGGFPALKELDLTDNVNMMDEGVEALARALLEASETRLWNLNLTFVRMTDAVVVALASVVSQGHFEELKLFSLTHNDDVTDEGITILARAIDARGLPMLETFLLDRLNDVADMGIGAITDALIKRCPQLALIVWRHWGPREEDVVRNKLQEAGRGNVKVIDNGEYHDEKYSAR